MRKIFESATMLAMVAAQMQNDTDLAYGRKRLIDKPSKEDRCKDCVKFDMTCRTVNPELPPCSGFRKYL